MATVHPEAQPILDLLIANFPAVETMTGAEARQRVKEQAVAVEPEPVGRVENRTIPGPAGAPDIPVRIYWPHGADGGEPLPLLVYFHGGGWVICDLDSHDPTCRALTNGVGCITVSVDYRLAPENRFPAAAEDAHAATVWVADNAEALGGDRRRLAVGGDSAGGNIAAVAALMARDRGGPALAFQLLIYPATDVGQNTPSYIENAEGYFLRSEAMAWFWRQYLGDDGDGAHPYASPLRAPDLSGLPPALVITAELDPLRDEGEAYGRRLQDAGIPATVARYDGVFHGFFGFALLMEPAKRAQHQAFDALRQAFTR